MRYAGKIIGIIGLCLALECQAQDAKPRNFFVNGYLKDMVSYNDLSDSSLVDNLIHSRLNLRWYPTSNFRVFGALRTRLFVGETPRVVPDFEEFIEYDTYYLDLSASASNGEAVFLHLIVDRLYAEWIKKDLTVKVGRQRINWGIQTVWNPNDIFNAYSYFDFDYEERPGTDAVRMEYYTGVNSSFELAASLPSETTDLVGRETNIFSAAGMYKTNFKEYDVQVMAGFSRENWVLGGGWAGNLRGASFKGEFTYFLPQEESEDDPEAFVGSLALEHSIGSFIYNISYLYNSAGPTELGPEGLIQLSSRALTAKNLSPYKHSTFLQGSYQFHPLWNGGLGVMLFPPNKAFFLSPFLTWNALSNFDLDLIVQGFYGEDFITGEFRSLSTSYFLRGKWSF